MLPLLWLKVHNWTKPPSRIPGDKTGTVYNTVGVENNNQAKRVPKGVILNAHFLKLSALYTRSNPHFLRSFDVDSKLGHECN